MVCLFIFDLQTIQMKSKHYQHKEYTLTNLKINEKTLKNAEK